MVRVKMAAPILRANDAGMGCSKKIQTCAPLPERDLSKQAGMLHKSGESGHVYICSVDGSPIGLQAIRDGWADMASGQPVNDFGVVVLRYIPQVLKGQAVKPGVVTQAGALWSPAKITINEDGTPVLDLSTTKITMDNVNNPHLWGNVSVTK